MTYAPGQSGNPAGRAKGSKNHVNAAFAAITFAEGENAIRAICRAAAAGDATAMQVFAQHLLPRIWPQPRGAPVRFALSGDPASATVLLADVVRAVARGEISPDDAERITLLARAKIEAVDTTEMLAILRRMEGGPCHDPRTANGSGVASDHEAQGREALGP